MVKQDRAFFDKPEHGTGALVSTLSTKPQSLQELLSFNITLILVGMINLVSSCILALIVGWKLGLVISFGALPAIILSGYLRIRIEFKSDELVEKRFSASTSLAAEAVAAIRTVASLTLERDFLRQYSSALAEIDKKSYRTFTWTMFWYSLSLSVSFLGMALGFW